MVSMADQILANRRFEFTSKAFGEDKFAVVEMEGFESISQPFRFVLTLVSDDASIDFDAMLSNPATFVIYGPQGEVRAPYHGILAEFEQLHRTDGYVFYRAILVPRLWRLSQYQISEVYLDERPIPELVRSVLESGRLSSADHEFKLTGTYRPRSFVCQYQETYLDFVSRWLEKEGIYYYFDHSGSAEKLIVVDDKVMHDAQVVATAYRPDDSLDTGVSAESVRNFVCRQKPLPHEVILQEYNYRKAVLHLKASATVSESGIGEVVLYGENFRNQEEGDRYAKLRAEEIICGGKVFSGEGTAMGLRSGYFFSLAHHYRDDFNGQYLVTEVHHEGSQAGALLNGVKSPYSDGERGGEIVYRNSFRAIPAARQFRPERVTAKPRMAGTMNATIDSEGSGEYAELDEYGQYKVQLPFDKTEKNPNKGSARLRMATPYAGTDHGMHFPLHKDAEVLLSFIDGDPDQPVIVGSLANSENPNVVTQDTAQANRISTAGGNQLYMGDAKGKEVIWLHSPYHATSIGIGSTDPKGGGSLWMATAGSSEAVTVGANNAVTVGPKTAITVGTSVAVSAGVNSNYTLGANVNATWGQNVAWNGGRSVTLSDAETVLLKTSAKLQGSTNLKLSGGMQPAIDVAVQSAKTSILRAAQISTAVNAALAVAAGFTVAAGTSAAGGDSTKGKLDIDNPWGYATTAGQLGGAALAGLNMFRVLRSGGNAIAEAVAASPAYLSNIELDLTGITASAVIPDFPDSGGEVVITPANISLTVKGVPGVASWIEMTDASVSILSGDVSEVVVDDLGVTLKSTTAVMAKSVEGVSLTAGANIDITADVAVSIEGAGRITLETAGRMAMDGDLVAITGATAIKATAAEVTLQGGASIMLDAPSVALTGALIRLG